jgi:hypothetical protein
LFGDGACRYGLDWWWRWRGVGRQGLGWWRRVGDEGTSAPPAKSIAISVLVATV